MYVIDVEGNALQQTILRDHIYKIFFQHYLSRNAEIIQLITIKIQSVIIITTVIE